jgi:hypothetical protein
MSIQKEKIKKIDVFKVSKEKMTAILNLLKKII